MERNPLINLDLNLLLALDRLLHRKSVTEAAKDLGLSQPATSRALGRLREILDDPLLVRVGREMVPTPRALELERPVAAAIEAARTVFERRAPFDPPTATGEVVIAMGDEAQIAFGDAIVGAINEAAPDIDVRIRTLSAASVDEGRRGAIDLAISPDLSDLPAIAGAPDLSDFVVDVLYTRRFTLAVPAARAAETWDLDRFCAASHVIVSFEGGGRGFVDELLPPGRTRRVAASVTSFPAAVRLVAATRLVATLPEEVVATLGEGVVSLPHPIRLPTMRMLSIWLPRLTRDPRHRFLRGIVKDAIVGRAEAWRG